MVITPNHVRAVIMSSSMIILHLFLRQFSCTSVGKQINFDSIKINSMDVKINCSCLYLDIWVRRSSVSTVTGLLSWLQRHHIRSPADLFLAIFTPTLITLNFLIEHFQSVRGGFEREADKLSSIQGRYVLAVPTLSPMSLCCCVQYSTGNTSNSRIKNTSHVS
jgi:hypothetical protein